MRHIFLRLAALPAALAGCASTLERERPFTPAWADHAEHEREFKARKARIGEGEQVLLGQPGRTRAAVELDDKGRPKLNMGRKSGLSADVDLNEGEPDVKVKYRLRW